MKEKPSPGLITDASQLLLSGNHPRWGNIFSYHNWLVTLNESDVRGYNSYPTAAALMQVMTILQITPKMTRTAVKYGNVKGRVTGYSKNEGVSVFGGDMAEGKMCQSWNQRNRMHLLWRTKFCRLQPKLESTFFFFRISSVIDFYWTYPTISPNHGASNVYKHSKA